MTPRRGASKAIAVGLIGAAAGSALTMLLTEWSAANLTAISTVILVAVTAVYAFLVHEQLQVMKDQSVDRQRARADQAAWIALEVIYSSGIRPGATEAVYSAAAEVFHALEQRAPFVEVVDSEVADRMRAAGVVAWMCSWDEDTLETEGQAVGIGGVTVGLARLRAGQIVERCSATLQAFLTSRPLPYWEDLPRYVEAQAWLLRPVSTT